MHLREAHPFYCKFNELFVSHDHYAVQVVLTEHVFHTAVGNLDQLIRINAFGDQRIVNDLSASLRQALVDGWRTVALSA